MDPIDEFDTDLLNCCLLLGETSSAVAFLFLGVTVPVSTCVEGTRFLPDGKERGSGDDSGGDSFEGGAKGRLTEEKFGGELEILAFCRDDRVGTVKDA